MLTISPIVLLLFTGIFVLLAGRLKLPAGRIWLSSVVVGLISLILMLAIRFFLPEGVVLQNWVSGSKGSDAVAFQFTNESWVFGFLIVSLMLAVIFFEAQHLENENYIKAISGAMVLTAGALIAISAQTNMAYAFAWGALDLLEIGIMVIVTKEPQRQKPAISSFFFRFCGLVALFLIISITNIEGKIQAFLSIQNLPIILILLIALFRSGVIPLHTPYTMDNHFRRGTGSLLRIIPPVTVLAYLVSIQASPYNGGSVILFIITGAVFLGGLEWFFARDELTGRPYWLISLVALGMISSIRNLPFAVISVGITLVTLGSVAFLNSPRFVKNRWILFLFLPALITLPFTPTAPIRDVFQFSANGAYDVLMLLGYAFLIAGFVKHAVRKEDESSAIEQWMRLFHISALVLLGLSSWVVGLFFIQQINGSMKWFVSILLLIMVTVITVVYWQRQRLQPFKDKFKLQLLLVTRVGFSLKRVFEFNWLTMIVKRIGKFVSKLLVVVQLVLEGDGGIIWSFLFLVLLASLLISNQVP